MKTIYYKCKLRTDVVLNSSLATQGNMATLSYIPGSNFLGIVASKLYNSDIEPQKALDLFHNGCVCFGDATISRENQISFTMPYSYYMDKLHTDLNSDPVYLHHALMDVEKDSWPTFQGIKKQLKQQRNGYILSNGKVIKNIHKNLTLKSAYDRRSGTSKDSQMFGFEALDSGQIFSFQIDYKDDSYIPLVESALLGKRQIGKSKNAEFGQVEISKLDSVAFPPAIPHKGFTLVYAQGHLCFTDAYGAPSYKPSVEDLGFSSGEIIWEKSQIRTHQYSPWNGKRNTPGLQRFCISSGSVFYVKDASTELEFNTIGLYNAEGLGRILYNPFFLAGDLNDPLLIRNKLKDITNLTEQSLKTEPKSEPSSLIHFLQSKVNEHANEHKISKRVSELVFNSDDFKIRLLKNIPSSQWGTIRLIAGKSKNMQELTDKLFKGDDAYLMHGVADKRYWNVNGESQRKALEEIISENQTLGPLFVAMFASEMAKEPKKYKNQSN